MKKLKYRSPLPHLQLLRRPECHRRRRRHRRRRLLPLPLQVSSFLLAPDQEHYILK